MVPQGQGAPAPDDLTAIVPISELQYVNLQGTLATVSGRSVVEIRVIEDSTDNIRVELIYENGDYSLIVAQSIHLLRNAGGTREVKLVRTKTPRMRFPRLP
jgi:hypothetical protein